MEIVGVSVNSPMEGSQVSITAFVEPFEDSEEEEDVQDAQNARTSHSRRDQFGFELDEDYSESHIRHALRVSRTDSTAWDELLDCSEWETDHALQPRLQRLARKLGVPAEHRQQIWWHLTGRAAVMANNEGVYSALVASHHQSVTHSFHEQIEKDLRRTFPGHALFDNENGLGQLRRVLLAYAAHNKQVGYCQSMNFITAFLLLIFEEEQSFWMLTYILDDLVPPDFYGQEMFGAILDQEVFSYLIKQKLPRIHSHAVRLGHALAATTSQWFLCLFVGIFTAEVTFRVWDSFFVNGYSALMRVGLALLKMHESEILQKRDSIELFVLLREIPKMVFDGPALVQLADAKFSSVHRKRLCELRERFRPTVRACINETQRKRQEAALRLHRLKERQEKDEHDPDLEESVEKVALRTRSAPPSARLASHRESA